MGVMGIWQWLIILIAIFLMPYIAVKRNSHKPGIKRMALLGRFAGIFITMALLILIAEEITSLALFTLPVQVCLGYLLYAFMVQRLTDAGWSPWLVFVGAIPMIGFLFSLVLFIVPSKDADLETDPRLADAKDEP